MNKVEMTVHYSNKKSGTAWLATGLLVALSLLPLFLLLGNAGQTDHQDAGLENSLHAVDNDGTEYARGPWGEIAAYCMLPDPYACCTAMLPLPNSTDCASALEDGTLAVLPVATEDLRQGRFACPQCPGEGVPTMCVDVQLWQGSWACIAPY